MKRFFKKLDKSIKKRIKEFLNYIRKGNKILVVSDSHGQVFEYIYDNNLCIPHIIDAKIIGGATAYGLNKENSYSFEIYKNYVNKNTKYDTVIIQLGEVDCAFLIWKKAQEKGIDVNTQVECSLNGYRRLLEILKDSGKNIIICGAILPTIKDGQIAPEGQILRNEISATQKERTDLVIFFNKELQKIAKECQCKYIDITYETINKEKGVLRDEFIELSKVDCHQNIKKTAFIWTKKLKEVL